MSRAPPRSTPFPSPTLFRSEFRPPPAQKPHPPIWVGGHTRPALRRTAELGDAWHPINRTPAELRSGRDELERLCRERGRERTPDRKSTRLNSSHANISYAVF